MPGYKKYGKLCRIFKTSYYLFYMKGTFPINRPKNSLCPVLSYAEFINFIQLELKRVNHELIFCFPDRPATLPKLSNFLHLDSDGYRFFHPNS